MKISTAHKIKIVHIIPTLQLGGAERILVDLIRYGNQQAFEFSVVTLVAGGPLEKDLRELGIPYYPLKKKTELGLGVLAELTALLNRLEPDIVHTHLFGGHVWGQIASLLNRVPIIVASEQNTDVDLGLVKTRVKQAVTITADVVVAASEAIKKFLVTTGGLPEQKITVIRNAIEVWRYVDLPAPTMGTPLKLIVIGRLEPQKGHDVLFEALSQLQFPWELSVVGEGSLYEDLLDRATLLRLNDRVKFLGTILDVAPLIAEHDVLVMASRWEGIGLVIMEGMAAGRTVVASRVGGIPELITSGETGLLVPPENPAELARALQWVHDHPAAAKQLGAAGREYVRTHCDVRQMVAEYERVYAHLVNQ